MPVSFCFCRTGSWTRARSVFGGPTALCLLSLYLLMSTWPEQASSQPLARGKSRFVGSAMTSPTADFSKYWNQVSAGNAGKWGSVEGVQDSYSWGPLDNIYNYAIGNSFPYKHHTLVWGPQQPDWIAGLDSAHQRAQVEEWIRLVAERYGSASMVDVVNEPFNSSPLPSYMNGLGGTGKTGWDWVVTSFSLARKYFFPTVKLLLNEYNVLQSNTVTDNYLRLIDTLRVRKLIDGIGIQGHYFEFKGSGYTYQVSTLKYNLDRLTATGLPVYISEFDINEPDDNTQLANYQVYFPLFWETPGVKGITLWGYLQYDVWKVDAYLVRADGSERPALKWLRHYLALPMPTVPVSPSGVSGEPRNTRFVWRSSEGAKNYRLQVATNRTFTPLVVDSTVVDTSLTVAPLTATATFYWRAYAANDSGTSAWSSIASFSTGDQVVEVRVEGGSPDQFQLMQNYPNPFNGFSEIGFRIPEGAWVKLSVCDVLGREVATLVNERRPAGSYQVRFSSGDLPSGMYLYRLNAGSHTETRKMVLSR
jgi:endo-1,4-beta-xylanase